MMNAVGGTSLHYWAQSWRLNPWDFKVVSETTRRYGAARLPKGSTIEDWPFGLEELEPFYDKVEYEVGVSGQAGNINGTIDQRGNIFEGSRQRSYPMPPLRGTEFTDGMAAAAGKLGWHAFPGPAAINSEVNDDRPGCQYHGFCSRGGCHVSAKNSTAVSTRPRALKTKRLRIATQATATSVTSRPDRTREWVVASRARIFQPADVVLLQTRIEACRCNQREGLPEGVGQQCRPVGRHFKSRQLGAVSVQSE
jgi:gluconate 2-dehydrogenase alpha chain